MKPELNHNATGVKRPFKLEEICKRAFKQCA